MSKMLLLADDSVVIQKLVGLSFANEDVEIVTTDNGDDAVVKAREIKPDVVLADVVMPGKSGYEVCEAIKQDPALTHIPVLLLTGTFEAFDESRATAAGANGQITKPFEAQALVERVNEVMNAPVSPVAAVTIAREPTPPSVDSSVADYDFFDPNVATLSAEDSGSSRSLDTSSTDQTPAIEADNAQLFGAPGEGATDELETQVGGLALGESVSPEMIPELPDNDATIAILPDSPPPLPPSAGDPLIGFEDDLGLGDLTHTAPTVPPISVDLDSALDAVPSDPGATIVAAIDDTNAATYPNHDDEGMIAIEDDDLTVHTPSSAIDHDVASAPSPVAIGSLPLSGRADATVVADLDVSLAEPAPEAAPAPPPTPIAPQTLDIGPSNVSPGELDFAFDVSEQVPAGELEDSFGEAFSSLMDISESQILAGPPSDLLDTPEALTTDTIVDDSFAAGYDVSSSDLATAPPTPPTHETQETPVRNESEARIDDSIAIGLHDGHHDGLQNRLQDDLGDDLQDHLQEDVHEIPQQHSLSNLETEREGLAADPATTTLSPEGDDLELGIAAPTSSGSDRIADLSPLVEQRIQETLEKVAWEAFSDLSESIVKQVLDRVEKIAWEVIPQMAETLVREEIRKMKGEKD